MSNVVEATTDIVSRIEAAASKMARAKHAVAKVVFGQEAVIERVLVTVLSGGTWIVDRCARNGKNADGGNVRQGIGPSTPNVFNSRQT